MYLQRQISRKVKEASEQFPVVFLTGPRQSGKTTLLKNIFPDYKYTNLEDPEIRQWATEQPRDFLDNNSWPVIIDEAQYAPELFSYIQGIVDEPSHDNNLDTHKHDHKEPKILFYRCIYRHGELHLTNLIKIMNR